MKQICIGGTHDFFVIIEVADTVLITVFFYI